MRFQNSAVHLDDAARMLPWLVDRVDCNRVLWPCVLTLHLTDRCDHHCHWCLFSRTSSCVDIDDTIDVLDHMIQRGTIREIVVSGGGEPLLHRNVDSLLSYLSTVSRVHRRLYTHGGLLHRYADAVRCGFDYVRVSVDAGGADLYGELHGVKPQKYYQILEVLGQIGSMQGGPSVAVSMVVTQANVSSIQRLIDDASSRDVHDVLLKPLVRDGRREYPSGPPVATRLEGSSIRVRDVLRDAAPLPKMPLGVASMNMVCVADGYVYPCCHSLDVESRISSISREALVLACESVDHHRILKNYASCPHPCRAHDVWTRWCYRGV